MLWSLRITNINGRTTGWGAILQDSTCVLRRSVILNVTLSWREKGKCHMGKRGCKRSWLWLCALSPCGTLLVYYSQWKFLPAWGMCIKGIVWRRGLVRGKEEAVNSAAGVEGGEEENNSGTVLWKKNYECGAQSISALCKRIWGAFSEVSRLLCSGVEVWVCCFAVVYVLAMIQPFTTVQEPLG